MSPSSPPEAGKEEKSKPSENPEEKKKWAIPVNITSPCDDFYKRIPNPAFKVMTAVVIALPEAITSFFNPLLCVYTVHL